MNGTEITTLIAILTATISLIIAIFYQRQQKRAAKDLVDWIKRVFFPTLPDTFQAIAKLFERRRNVFKQVEKDLEKGTQEPWITDLSEIVELKKQEKGEK